MRTASIRPKLIIALLCVLLTASLPQARASGDFTHILLIGADRRPGETGCRSDAVILCSIREETGAVVLTSFLRDLYMPIPGHGGDRLNGAYAYGGRRLLVQTLEECLNISIDGCLEADFAQFPAIIDALGGVAVTLREDEGERLGLSPGLQVLDGKNALAYSRIRDLDPDGDFSRTRRQRTLLKSILEAWQDAGFTKILAMVQQLIPMITTDMDPARLLHLAFRLAPRLSQLNLSTHQLPTRDCCTPATVRGMYVLVPEEGKLPQLFQEALEKAG